MKKIKLFFEDNKQDLERLVNQFLTNCEQSSIRVWTTPSGYWAAHISYYDRPKLSPGEEDLFAAFMPDPS
jgi:hypothetical protein